MISGQVVPTLESLNESPPNPRVQRTRSSASRRTSPLTRRPLGGHKLLKWKWGIVMRLRDLALVWLASATASAQMLNPTGTLVLGAGKAGNWDTSIAVTNVDSEPLDIRIRPWLRCCSLCSCPQYAIATVEPLATYVLSALPELPPPYEGPQAVYVASALSARRPVVSAVVADQAGACERSMSLPGLPLDLAFAPGDLVFAGVGRATGRYSNLIMTVDPPTGPPEFTETSVRVVVRDSAGTELATSTYSVTSDSAVVIVDVLRDLGVSTLDNGSVRLSVVLPQSGGTGVRFAAVMTVVEPHRALAVQGTRVAVVTP